jgi:hypothetical protein
VFVLFPSGWRRRAARAITQGNIHYAEKSKVNTLLIFSGWLCNFKLDFSSGVRAAPARIIIQRRICTQSKFAYIYAQQRFAPPAHFPKHYLHANTHHSLCTLCQNHFGMPLLGRMENELFLKPHLGERNQNEIF